MMMIIVPHELGAAAEEKVVKVLCQSCDEAWKVIQNRRTLYKVNEDIDSHRFPKGVEVKSGKDVWTWLDWKLAKDEFGAPLGAYKDDKVFSELVFRDK